MTNILYSIAQAQTGPLSQIDNANDLVDRIASIGNVVVYLLVALAVVYIVWATVQYIMMGDSGEGRREAGMRIMWGIVGLAIIVSIWGLVNILLNTFATDYTTPTNTNGFPNANFINHN